MAYRWRPTPIPLFATEGASNAYHSRGNGQGYVKGTWDKVTAAWERLGYMNVSRAGYKLTDKEYREIGSDAGVGIKFAKKVIRGNMGLAPLYKVKGSGVVGRPPIDNAVVVYLDELTCRIPDLSLSDYKTLIRLEVGVDVSTGSISNILKDLGLPLRTPTVRFLGRQVVESIDLQAQSID